MTLDEALSSMYKELEVMTQRITIGADSRPFEEPHGLMSRQASQLRAGDVVMGFVHALLLLEDPTFVRQDSVSLRLLNLQVPGQRIGQVLRSCATFELVATCT